MFTLYLKAPDVEILVLEDKWESKNIPDNLKHLPWFSLRELDVVIDKWPSPAEFRAVARAKQLFPGRLNVG